MFVAINNTRIVTLDGTISLLSFGWHLDSRWLFFKTKTTNPQALKTNHVWKKVFIECHWCVFTTLHTVDIKNTLSRNAQQCNHSPITVISLQSSSFRTFHTHGVNRHIVFPNFNITVRQNPSYWQWCLSDSSWERFCSLGDCTLATPCLWLVGMLCMNVWPFFLQGLKKGGLHSTFLPQIMKIFAPNYEKWVSQIAEFFKFREKGV